MPNSFGMHTINVTAPCDDGRAVEEALIDICAALGLQIAMSGGLKRYPGSVHWHLKRAKASGTLEVTVWPEGAKLWVSYHANRASPWVQETAPALAAALQARLTPASLPSS